MPITTTHVQNSFGLGLYSSHRSGTSRSNSDMTSPSPAAAHLTVARASSSSGTSSSAAGRRHPLTSLEDIAAKLESSRLCPSPSAELDLLLGDGKPIGIPLLTKSRSLPNFSTSRIKSSSSSKPPLRKAKSVRFADTQGLPLVEAVHQLSLKDSSYTANKIVPYDDQEDILGCRPLILTAPEVSTVGRNSLPLARNSPPTTHARRQNSPNSRSPVHKHTFTFTQPSLEPDFFERVKKESVVLESIREEPRSLHGIVRVSNLSYCKDVTIRWTHDGWRTSHDTSAVFCSNDGNTDRFAFELPINGDDVSFAIRYKVESGEHWDNNRGANYTVTSRL